MTAWKKFTGLAALAAVIAAGDLALTTMPAAAWIACDRRGDCWHVRDRFDYPRGVGITVHPDNWRWGRRDRFRWREHDGRGYWRNGAWVAF
ncbi:MAG TPA: hypothetical protein VG501_00595 [Rhizomicrobium sp.]|nr:hypothetical protein [Rhizomicrobium sp.]